MKTILTDTRIKQIFLQPYVYIPAAPPANGKLLPDKYAADEFEPPTDDVNDEFKLAECKPISLFDDEPPS